MTTTQALRLAKLARKLPPSRRGFALRIAIALADELDRYPSFLRGSTFTAIRKSTDKEK